MPVTIAFATPRRPGGLRLQIAPEGAVEDGEEGVELCGDVGLEALIEWIESQFAQVQKLRDRRVMIEIGDSYFRIER